MKPKKTNIKIKHRKYNLYNRKKSKGKQVLTVIIMIVIVLALAVIGYGAGKPIVEYFSSKGNETSDSTPSWTPPATAEADETSSAETQTAQPAPEETAEPEPALTGMYVLPQDAVYDAASLKSAVVSAKNAGYTGVVVTAKDTEGYFLYSSDIDGIKGGSSVKGTLTAKEMCDIITAEGLIPAARFSTLLDRTSGGLVGGCYALSDGSGNWLDAAPSAGGKKWMDPFSTQCTAFMENIAGELSAAGFKYLIAADTMYPDFHPSDYNVYLYSLPIGDAEKRADALWGVLDAVCAGAEKNGAEVIAEVDGGALFSGDRQATDAELAEDAEKLNGISLLIDYSDDLTYSGAKSFIGRMGAQFAGQTYAVLADSGASEGALEDMQRAFGEAGVTVFVK